MVTTRLALGLIQNNPGITVKGLSEAFPDFPADRTVRFVRMLVRNRVVEVEGEGVLATITSRSRNEGEALQAARNAGIEVATRV